jgi:hypothetical protein
MGWLAGRETKDGLGRQWPLTNQSLQASIEVVVETDKRQGFSSPCVGPIEVWKGIGSSELPGV